MSLINDALRKARQEAAEKERRAQGLDLPHIAPPPAGGARLGSGLLIGAVIALAAAVLGGAAAVLALAWALGGMRRPSARFVASALGLQVALVVVMFGAPPVRAALLTLTGVVNALQDATRAGSSFVFGYVGGGDAPFAVVDPNAMLSLAFQSLPLVLVISGLSAVLWHWRVLQLVCGGFALVFRRLLGLSGAASLGVAANIFLGMVEAPILVRPYLAGLSRSELFTLMTAGMATVAGTVRSSAGM